MNQCIVYQKDDGGVAVIHPVSPGMSIQDIAKKDVPTGKPYKIILVSELPATREQRNAWTIDPATLTDGVGE